MLMNLSSMAASEVVILTTSGAAIDDKFVNMTTFPFRWLNVKFDMDELVQNGRCFCTDSSITIFIICFLNFPGFNGFVDVGKINNFNENVTVIHWTLSMNKGINDLMLNIFVNHELYPWATPFTNMV